MVIQGLFRLTNARDDLFSKHLVSKLFPYWVDLDDFLFLGCGCHCATRARCVRRGDRVWTIDGKGLRTTAALEASRVRASVLACDVSDAAVDGVVHGGLVT